MTSPMPLKIPAYQVLQYSTLVWFILKRRVLESLRPYLDVWKIEYNITHVEVGLPQGNLTTMWSDMWSESERTARFILGDNAEEQIEPSEFLSKFNRQMSVFFDQGGWVKSNYLWLKILHPYFEDLIHLVVSMRNKIFENRDYEPFCIEKAADLVALFWTNFEYEQWEELVLQAIVMFLHDAYCPTNRERSEHPVTAVHVGIFTREAVCIMRRVSYV